MATLYRARAAASTLDGTTSASRSANGATSMAPSSTTEPAGSSCEDTRMPNGDVPAGTSAERGGANRTVIVVSSPGSRFTVAGSAVAHRAGSPTTSIANWSTTPPELRTTTEQVTSCPASTTRLVAERLAV